MATRAGIGRLALGLVLFAVFGNPALLALPLVLLMAASHPSTRNEILLLTVCGGFGIWWLLSTGPLPDQTLRAASLIGAGAFAIGSFVSRWSTTHRSLLAVALATVTVAMGYVALKLSWTDTRWLVEHEISGLLSARIWMTPSGQEVSPVLTSTMLSQPPLASVPRIIADYFPAIIALQMIAGFALVNSLYHRVSRKPSGRPLARLRDFSFSEQLGWAAVIPLVVLLIPKLSAVKLAASNVLLVAGALYALRGAAVVSFLMSAAGAGFIVYALIWVALLFMLPVMVAGAVMLGIVDSGVNLRNRWAKAAANR